MTIKKSILIISMAACFAANMPFARSEEKNIGQTVPVSYTTVAPLQLVATPSTYLNKKVKFTADFDKFSTIGLDYKGAFRDSQKYISFLIKRSDVADHDIPLSELKLIIPRDKAEKLIDLENGDKLEISGTLFSNALNDPWVDVENVNVLTTKAPKEKKAEIPATK